jgi:hypothetical protein
MTADPGDSRGQEELTPDEFLSRIDAGRDLTADEAATLARLYEGPGDDDDRDWDPESEPPPYPPGEAELDDPDEPTVPEALEAGFTHRYGGTGTGFSAGGPLDLMLPGPELGWYAGAARARGLGVLSDDELVGVLCAARRLSSWQAELELAVVAELDARRAGPDGREGEHVTEEIAAALTLTGRSAGSLLELSRRLGRLPQTRALLAAGIIDRSRAGVIADQLALLPDDAAAAVEDRVAPRAGHMTTGRLADACRRAALDHDPQAAARRKEQAEQGARVECWAEPSGTGAIGGRDLNLAAVIIADKHLDSAARWLQRRGAPGTHDQLRAQVFLARLTGQSLDSLLPQPAAGPAARGGPDPAEPGSPSHCPAGPAGLGGGSVNLVMPAAAWLGLADSPGEIAGLGAADAATCRDLAAALAARGGGRWCLTLTDRNGRAVAHGCARAGPGPPSAVSDPAAWLRRTTTTPIETGTCSHTRESAAYRLPDSLRHLIKIRDRRCGYPGCRRPATRCDDDHTIPYHKGGRTCECNLYPLCRRHHRTKQAPGWHLSQPEPGQLAWTTPSGRRYAVTAEAYAAAGRP